MTYAIAGQAWRETEFVGGLTGACGPNALAMAASRATQRYHSTLSVYQMMRAHGLCTANGVSSISVLYQAAKLLGLPVAAYQPYTGSAWGWEGFIGAHLGHGPIVIELSNGQALRDAVTGLGENARGLRYHFIAILGSYQGRLLCADGDNFAAGNVLQTYTLATLQAAAPCAALAIAQVAKIAPLVAPSVSKPKPPAPKPAWVAAKAADGSEWYQQTATGKRVGSGLLDVLKMHHWDNLPLVSDEVWVSKTRSAVAVGCGSDAHVLAWDHEARKLVTSDQGPAIAAGYMATLPAAEGIAK